MLIIKNTLGTKGQDTVIAEVPFTKAPKIVKEKVVKGIKYYFGENGKQYIADRFDAFFKRACDFKMKGRYHKGYLIGQASWR